MQNISKYNIQISLLLLFIFITSFSKAESVDKATAEVVATNFFHSAYLDKYGNNNEEIIIENSIVELYNNNAVYYIINFKNSGFVLVSADDAAYPILAFDFDNHIDTSINAINYKNWILKYKQQINYIIEQKLAASDKTKSLWNKLKSNKNAGITSGKSVDPLLLSTWNQGAKYNAFCPEEEDGPGGRVYAGCVATAMGQLMYYYRYPYQGIGSHAYNYSPYGTMSANFGTTTYNWNAMTNSISSNGNDEIAQLLYHLGISVEMMYSASGSGAYSFLAANSLKDYFKYSSNLSYDDKDSYSYNDWVSKIVTNIDAKHPLYYDGSGNGGGHAFNLDGYQGSDHFHFNWGWGGAYNGYFYINNLNPGSNLFNYGQDAMFQAYPANSYPYFCNANNQFTSLEGNFEDGSGIENYHSNSQCNWLIKPNQLIDHIKISFDRFDLESGDTLYIYDGDNNTDSLIAKLNGSIIPSSLYSTAGSLFFEFKSDSSQTSSGFDISYKCYLPVYCSGTLLFTDSIGSLEDGSGNNNYNNSTYCKWSLKPANGKPIRLIFDSFDLEQGLDKINIYDNGQVPSLLLATYTGNSIPSDVVSQSGRMLITFITNSSIKASGWNAHYITGNSVGIKENNIKNIRIYPNPANDFIMLEQMNNEILKIQLLSIEGKIIKEFEGFNTNDTKIKLDISSVNSGIYIIRILTNTNSLTKKVIIQSK